MRKASLLVISIFLFLLFISACSNENEGINSNALAETDDVDTLIKNNENLIKQLEKKQEEVEKLNTRLEEFNNENLALKNDFLTFKQQIFDLEDLMIEERELRNKLDEKSQYIFEAMSDRDHEQLEDLLAKNVQVNRTEEILEIEMTQVTSTFDYVTLSDVSYLRQGDYKYDPEEKIFSLQYVLYVEEIKGEERVEKTIYLTFAHEEEWKLTQISPHPYL